MMELTVTGYCHRQETGFSLIELMIAMLLGLVLMAGVINIFLGSNQTYRLQDAMFRMQESGRFALNMILNDARNAGFQDVLPDNVTRTDSVQAVQGYTSTDQESLKDMVISRVSSDIFVIDTHDGLSAGGVAYYIATDVAGFPALYRSKSAAVEGVEGLIIQYGRDTDGNRQVDQFDNLADIPANSWGEVVSLRVNLYVAAGLQGVLETQQVAMQSPFNDVDTSDRRLYQSFATTIALRNKMP